MTFYITNVRALSNCDNFVDSIDAGTGTAQLVIYSGSVPADADAALGGAVILAEINLQDPSFGAASDQAPGAQASMQGVPLEDSSANNTGTASFFRIFNKSGTTICQGAVGTTGAELNLNTTSIQSGATVSITSFTVDQPES